MLTQEQRKFKAETLKEYRRKERMKETEEQQEIRMAKYKDDENYSGNRNYSNPIYRMSEQEYQQGLFDSNFRQNCMDEDRFSEHF